MEVYSGSEAEDSEEESKKMKENKQKKHKRGKKIKKKHYEDGAEKEEDPSTREARKKLKTLEQGLSFILVSLSS